jgi:hypothetical protein
MDTLQLLGVALGLATLAGINLYLTVFLSGLAINQGWIHLLPPYEKLAILGDPAIITVAGVLFAIEFCADKVPWLDSFWDSIHTLIRPVGGALLAIQVLGNSNPVFDVIVGLMAGSVTLSAHALKAGTRLVANTSPEPFTNVALSVTEDVAVVGGLYLTAMNPILMLATTVFLFSLSLYLLPRVFRGFRLRLSLLWNKLNQRRHPGESTELPTSLTPRADIAFHQARPEKRTISWALPTIVGRVRGVPAGTFGYLVGTREHPGVITFVPRNGDARKLKDLEVAKYKVARQQKVFADRLTLYSEDGRTRIGFIFHAYQSPDVRLLTRHLDRTLGASTVSTSDATRESEFSSGAVAV